MLCSSQIKNDIITGMVNNFLMHLVEGDIFFAEKKTPLVTSIEGKGGIWLELKIFNFNFISS